VVDGRSMPRHPFDPDAPAISRNLPLLVGTAKDETTSLVGGRDESLFRLTWDDLPKRLGADLPGRDVAQVITELRRIEPSAKPSDIYFTATTEARFRRNAYRQAERKAAQGGAPTFMYLFAWETPVDGGKWKSPHSVEHAMVFDNVAKSASMIGSGPDQQKVADAVSGAWLRFAKTGNPGWAPYSPDRRTTMVFNVESKTVDDPRRAERLLFA
jgi:para-nitrobenzyl esterase